MLFLIGLLTVIMVLNCAVLILLVLVQLPKKEAGAGLAFGGGASDALFGAGSGTVLTRITKYSAIIFFVLAIILAVMQSKYHRRTTSEFERELAKPASAPAVLPTAPATTPAPSGAARGLDVPDNVPVPKATPAEASNAVAPLLSTNLPSSTPK